MTRWDPSTLSIYCPGQESPRPQGRQRLLRPRPAALYQPIACPRQVATNAPTIPRMVSEDKARKLVRAGVKKFCDNTSNEADDNGPKEAHTNLRALRPVLQPRGEKWLRPPIERPPAGHMTATDFCVAREVNFCQAGAIHTKRRGFIPLIGGAAATWPLPISAMSRPSVHSTARSRRRTFAPPLIAGLGAL
jgi:hypothetical protein